MTSTDRALDRMGSRADEVRMRRVREERHVERPPRERSKKLHRNRRPRRRYDVALPVERGAEMRLPAIPVLRPGPRWASAILLSLSVWSLVLLLTVPGFKVGQALVVGNRLLSDGQLRSIARVDGESIFQVDPQAVVGRLLAYPEVAAVEASVGWPNQVEIRVVERQPMVAWMDGARSWWISSEGIAFTPHGDWPGVVAVESAEPVLAVSEDPMAAVIPPATLQAAAVLNALIPEFTPLRYDVTHGLGFDDPRGWTTYFGLGGDMVLKVRVYQALVVHLTGHGLQPALVSVEDASAPYYRMGS